MQTKQHSLLCFFAGLSIMSACVSRVFGGDHPNDGKVLTGESGWTDLDLASWIHPVFLEYRQGGGALLTKDAIASYSRKPQPQAEVGRPVTLDEYKKSRTPYKPTLTVRVPAEVVFADYQLLKHDFPFLSELSEEAIDAWLVSEFAWMAESQAVIGEKKGVQSVSRDKDLSADLMPSRYQIRPIHYGRALLMTATIDGGRVLEYNFLQGNSATGDVPLMDVKGAGALDPVKFSEDIHNTGLMSFSEAVREFLFGKIVEEIFASMPSEKAQEIEQRTGVRPLALPNYAVLKLDMRIVMPLGLTMPSALLLRRSHIRLGLHSHAGGNLAYESRTHDGTFVAPNSNLVEYAKAVELYLRSFGITSTGDFREPDSKELIDRENIQVTRNLEVVDFGAFKVKRRFATPLALIKPGDSSYYSRPGGYLSKRFWAGSLTEKEVEGVQPGPLKLDAGTWGLTPGLPSRAVHLDRPALSAIWLGEQAMAGIASRKTYRSYLCRRLLPPLSKIAPERLNAIGYLKNCPQFEGLNTEEDSAVTDLMKRLSDQ